MAGRIESTLTRHYLDVRTRLRNPPPRIVCEVSAPAPIIVPDARPAKVTLRDVIRAVEIHYGTNRRALASTSRAASLMRPRHVTFYLGHYLAGMSLPTIGRLMNRHHSSVFEGATKIRGLLSDPETEAEVSLVAAIAKQITAQRGGRQIMNNGGCDLPPKASEISASTEDTPVSVNRGTKPLPQSSSLHNPAQITIPSSIQPRKDEA